MLHKVIYADDADFRNCVRDLTQLYWPKQLYDERVKEALPATLPLTAEKSEDNIRTINNVLKATSDEVGKCPLYHLYRRDGTDTFCQFPFIDRFHKYFFRRQWDEPTDTPRANADEYIHLRPYEEREQEEKGTGRNYSKNYRNYHHFINVVTVLARLIRYFSDPTNVISIFQFRTMDDTLTEHDIEGFSRTVSFSTYPDFRSFKLMLAGVYHDIGKTITDPRHGGEGYTILAFHTTLARSQLNEIAKTYSAEFDFHRDDLLYIANLVKYHDQFGTLGTGEDSYIALRDVITELERYSRYREDAERWAQRCLFDLWILNVADIMASTLEDKWKLQKDWWAWEKARSRIGRFFRGIDNDPLKKGQSSSLCYDFVLALSVLSRHISESPWSDTSQLEQSLSHCARRNSTDRLRRLLTSALSSSLAVVKRHIKDRTAKEEKTQESANSQRQEREIANRRRDAWLDFERKFLPEINGLSAEQWDSSIVRSIESVANIDDFFARLASIGKMDYALAFFSMIVGRALQHIGDEFTGTGERTHWIRSNHIDVSSDYLYKTQAQFIADNYTATVIQIVSYLLYREAPVTRIRNIEFRDARDRLQEEKIDMIISLAGPFRARRATQLILQSVYIY